MISALFAGSILALASSLHCVGMCGPLALVLKLNFKNNHSIHIILYHLGRLSAYLFLGMLASLFGKALLLIIPSQILSVVIGMIIILGLLGNQFFKSKLAHIKPLNQTRNYLLKKKNAFVFGLGNGLIPCGLVYTALGLATLYQNSASSMLFMLGFGLGTFPATMLIQFVGSKLNLKKYLKPQLSKLIIAVMAGLFIIRGLNLGIPYVSPKVISDSTKTEVNCCNP